MALWHHSKCYDVKCNEWYNVVIDYSADLGALLCGASLARIDPEVIKVPLHSLGRGTRKLTMARVLLPSARSLRDIDLQLLVMGYRAAGLKELLALAAQAPDVCHQRALACSGSVYRRFWIAPYLPFLDIGTAGRLLLLRRFERAWCLMSKVELACVRLDEDLRA